MIECGGVFARMLPNAKANLISAISRPYDELDSMDREELMESRRVFASSLYPTSVEVWQSPDQPVNITCTQLSNMGRMEAMLRIFADNFAY